LPKLEARFKSSNQRSAIINLSSQAALMPAPHHFNYAATKVFDDFFSKSLFYELRPLGIDVLTVNPGMVATALTKRKVNL
jgi:17beta-estradiol 17-dehydrogenase / very-long-chain 3-oxoacyl-CoA reductase